MHAVAAGQVEVAQRLQPAADQRQVVLVRVVIHRYALGIRTTQPSMTFSALTRPIASISRRPSSTRRSSGMHHRSSPAKQKYSSPRLLWDGLGTRSGDQFLKF